MKIDKNLTNIGIDEFVITKLISNTKQFKNVIVESATLLNKNNETYCVKAIINSSTPRRTYITLHTTTSKIRDIKISNILNETN